MQQKSFTLFAIVYFLICVIFTNCTKNSNTSDTNTLIKKGTKVKYEILLSESTNTTQWPSAMYSDSQGNFINVSSGISSGWTYSFEAAQNLQQVYLSVGIAYSDVTNPPSNITARIYINGVLKKEALGGTSVSLSYPQ